MSAVGGSRNAERLFSELLSAAGISLTSEADAVFLGVRVRAVTDDSRQVSPGSCFVAIPGARHDGRRFIAEAVERGATVIVTDPSAPLPQGVGAVRVHDVRSALARLAAAFYGFAPGQRYAGMRLIGVTGTNGKSTTSLLLRAILASAGHPTALVGTIHYDLAGVIRPAPWTTPPPAELYACLAEAAERGATHAVMEVSSHALAQSRCDGHRFCAGVFTNLSGDHLDYHGDPDSYARAKKKLFDMLDAPATAVVNADDARWVEMVADCRARVMRFGLGAAAEVRARVESVSIEGSRFALRSPLGDTLVSLRLTGRHNVSNALAAAATALALGVKLDEVRRGLESVDRVAGRLQRVGTNGRGFHVFVDYAHTDDALENVLSALRLLTAGRLICVFGCGGDRDRTKRPRMARAVAAWADAAVVTSDNPRTEEPLAIIKDVLAGFAERGHCSVEVEPDRRAAIFQAVQSARAGDTVLIAGKGHEDYQIIGDTRRHFDDVEVASEALAGGEEVCA